MAWTQADLDAIKGAIALGALEVEHPLTGKVKYRSLADMVKTMDLIASELTGNGETTGGDNRVATGMRTGFTGSRGFRNGGFL